jgi:hypothetical protein
MWAWQAKLKICDWEKMRGHFLPFGFLPIGCSKRHVRDRGVVSGSLPGWPEAVFAGRP